jgi:predicted NAD/FAD-dependent oxidoreductase
VAPDAQSVVVIGAGLSGIVLARHLVLAGHRVQVLEKSRGIGGRISTRREGELRFDHGAPFVYAPNALIAGALRGLESDNVLVRSGDAWIGTPSMNALPRWFANEVTVHGECTAHALLRTEAGWRVVLTDEREFDADVVLFAIPAPQAVALLQRSAPDVVALTASVHGPLARVTMSPCWSIMCALDDAVDLVALPLFGDDGLRLYAQHTRPGRSTHHAWVAHASSAWSTQHLEDDASAVEARMASAIADAHRGVVPTFLRAHRWRFANVLRGLDAPFLWDAETGIGACGDWARMSDASGDEMNDSRYGILRAYESASALGQAIRPTFAIADS